MLNKVITSPTQCPYCEGSDCCGRELEPDIDELEAENARLKGLLESLKCCGNCEHSGRTGARQICIGCHGYKDVSPKEKKTYLKKWQARTILKELEG